MGFAKEDFKEVKRWIVQENESVSGTICIRQLGAKA